MAQLHAQALTCETEKDLCTPVEAFIAPWMTLRYSGHIS